MKIYVNKDDGKVIGTSEDTWEFEVPGEKIILDVRDLVGKEYIYELFDATQTTINDRARAVLQEVASMDEAEARKTLEDMRRPQQP